MSSSTQPHHQPQQTLVVASSDKYTDIVASSSLAKSNNDENNNNSHLLGRIYLPRDEIDPEALKQVESMCTHPACKNCRSMPDTCKGNGCSVGFTSQLTPVISPQLIGGDIACGISAIGIPKKVVERRNGLERILNIIHAQIPLGSGPEGVHQSAVIRLEQYVPFLEQASLHWRDFNAAYMERFGVNLDQHVCQKYATVIPPPHEAENVNALGNAHTSSASASEMIEQAASSAAPNGDKSVAKFQYTLGWLQKRVQEWGISLEQLKCSACSLGSGNHFYEIGQKTYVLDDHTTKPTPPPKGSTSRLTNNTKSQKEGSKSSDKKKSKKETENVVVEKNHQEEEEDIDANILKSFGAKTTNRNKQQPQNGNNESESDSDKEDGDDNEDGDNLPEYLLSCHTGSRSCGQAIYRFWTKKCAQYQQARIQLQQLQMLQRQLAVNGGKLSAEQEKDLAAAAAVVNVSLGRKPNAPPPLTTHNATGTSSTSTPNNRSPSLSAQKSPGNTSNNNNDTEQDDTSTFALTEAVLADEFAPPKNDDDENIPFNTSFLLTSPEDVALYYMDVIFAQSFASMNRRAILSTIFNALGDKAGKFKEENMIETVHNYIDFKDFVIRKGAIRAHAGEKVLIGLNMKEGLWLAQGKGNADWNNSCAHGCGRIMSRKAAAGGLAGASSASSSSSKSHNKKGSNKSGNNDDAPIAGSSSKKGSKAQQQQQQDPRLRQFKAEMGGVVSQTVNAGTFDERPSVYRNSSLVRSLIEPTAELICRYRTILNAKGSTGGTTSA